MSGISIAEQYELAVFILDIVRLVWSDQVNLNPENVVKSVSE